MNQVIRASETKEKEIEAEIEQLQKQRGSVSIFILNPSILIAL